MEAAKIVTHILTSMKMMVGPGVSTAEIDRAAAALLKEYGAEAGNKGYKPAWAQEPYPASTCISVNSTIVHGIPSDYRLKEGDIVNLDLSVKDKDGFYGDAALTVPVGEVDNRKARLLYYARQVVYEAVQQVRAGLNTRDLAQFISQYAALRGYRVNRRYGGHAIGKELHGFPKIYNTVEPGHTWATLQAGQVICIEIPLTPGKDDYGITSPGGWEVFTHDGQPSAYFEHMVEVTELGYKILTDHFDQYPTHSGNMV